MEEKSYIKGHLYREIYRNEMNGYTVSLFKIKDNNIDYFVENGTLVLKIDRIINYAIDEIILFKDLQSLENYTKSVEEYIKNKLNIPVRILFNDKAIVSE